MLKEAGLYDVVVIDVKEEEKNYTITLKTKDLVSKLSMKSIKPEFLKYKVNEISLMSMIMGAENPEYQLAVYLNDEKKSIEVHNTMKQLLLGLNKPDSYKNPIKTTYS